MTKVAPSESPSSGGYWGSLTPMGIVARIGAAVAIGSALAVVVSAGNFEVSSVYAILALTLAASLAAGAMTQTQRSRNDAGAEELDRAVTSEFHRFVERALSERASQLDTFGERIASLEEAVDGIKSTAPVTPLIVGRAPDTDLWFRSALEFFESDTPLRHVELPGRRIIDVRPEEAVTRRYRRAALLLTAGFHREGESTVVQPRLWHEGSLLGAESLFGATYWDRSLPKEGVAPSEPVLTPEVAALVARAMTEAGVSVDGIAAFLRREGFEMADIRDALRVVPLSYQTFR